MRKILTIFVLAISVSACATTVVRDNLKVSTNDPRVGQVAADPKSDYSTPVEKACAGQISQGKPMLVQQGNDSFLCMPMPQTGGGFSTLLSVMQKGVWENYRNFDIVVSIHSQVNLPYGNQTFPIAGNSGPSVSCSRPRQTDLPNPCQPWYEFNLFPGTYTYTITNRVFGTVLETGDFKVDGIPGNAYSALKRAPLDFVESTR